MRLFHPKDINLVCIHRENRNFILRRLRIWFLGQNQPTYGCKHLISFLGLCLQSTGTEEIKHSHVAAHTEHKICMGEAAGLWHQSYHLERHGQTCRDHLGWAERLSHHLQHLSPFFANISRYHFSVETWGSYQSLCLHWIAQIYDEIYCSILSSWDMHTTFKLFSTQMRLMKLFQRKTLVTEDVLSHCYGVGSALFNWWFIILHIISNLSPAQGLFYTRCSMNMEQRDTFCFQELLVLVEGWRGRLRQMEGEIKGTSQDRLPGFE